MNRNSLPGKTMTRIGAVLPSVNTVIEPLYWRSLPSEISLHSARVFLSSPLTAAGLIAMRDQVVQAGRCLASCRVSVVVYLCTASGFADDAASDQRAMEELEAAVGVPVVTVVDAIESACERLGVSNVILISPYSAEFERSEIEMFDGRGIRAVAHQSLGIVDPFELASPRPHEIAELVRKTWRDDADSILITCANLRSQEVIAELEQKFGVPVITSTQAPLWLALRTVGIRDSLLGWGKLFSL